MGNGSNHKPSVPSAISSATFHQLSQKVDKLEKQVEEALLEKNQWNAMVRGWVGSRVRIKLMGGNLIEGKLSWIDRYTMCLVETGLNSMDPYAVPAKGVGVEEVIVHKGAIAWMHQLK